MFCFSFLPERAEREGKSMSVLQLQGYCIFQAWLGWIAHGKRIWGWMSGGLETRYGNDHSSKIYQVEVEWKVMWVEHFLKVRGCRCGQKRIMVPEGALGWYAWRCGTKAIKWNRAISQARRINLLGYWQVGVDTYPNRRPLQRMKPIFRSFLNNVVLNLASSEAWDRSLEPCLTTDGRLVEFP